MGDITRVITLGIGPAATIDGFILVGLNMPVVQTIPGCVTGADASLYGITLADVLFGTITMADAESAGSVAVGDEACNIALPLELEDLSAYWIFEDDSIMEWA